MKKTDMAKNRNWLMILAVVAIGAVVLIMSQAGTLSGAATFGTSGVSSRELPMGICVVEVDKVVGGNFGTFGARISGTIEEEGEFLDLVITETGRKPAFAKVQSLWIYAEPEDESSGIGNVFWDAQVRTMSRTLNGIPTGVPDKTAFFGPSGAQLFSGGLAIDLISHPLVESNGLPIASQGRAGEVRLGLFAGDSEDAYDLHIVAVVESPVGNLCSMNLIPTRGQTFD